jgi:hypothetical protein
MLESEDGQLFSISNNNIDRASIRTVSHAFRHKITCRITRNELDNILHVMFLMSLTLSHRSSFVVLAKHRTAP